MASADRVTVLRQGKVTFTATRFEGFGADQLITHMMGTKILVQIDKRSVAGAIHSSEANEVNGVDDVHEVHEVSSEGTEIVLTLDDISIYDDHQQCVLSRSSLVLNQGTIVGIAGISGNGQKELFVVLFGLRQVSRIFVTGVIDEWVE